MLAAALWLFLPQVIHGEPTDWPEIVDNTSRGVVSVRSRIRIPVGRDEVGPFEGTGFIVDLERGFVATNRHVAGEGVVLDLEVRFFNNAAAPAKLIYADPLHDFAFLQFDPKAAPAQAALVPLEAREPDMDEEIRMIGNNGGLAFTVLSGKISNLDAYWEEDPGVAFVQTSIASSGGSSGSPIIDDAGNAIGMQTAHDEHTSYALPIEYIDTALRKLRKGATPRRGTLGLRLRPTDAAEARAAGALAGELYDIFNKPGAPALAIVEGVVPDSPCEVIAVAGDVVISIAGAPAGELRAVEIAIDRSVGGDVELQIARAGKLITNRARVADLAGDGVDKLILFAGAAFQDVTYELRARADLRKRGVFVAHVEAGSAAEAAGLSRDDVVESAGGRQIMNIDGFWNLISNSGNGDRLVLVVRRPSSFDSATRTITLVTDKIWDPTRFLGRTPFGWVDAPPAAAAAAAAADAESRPGAAARAGAGAEKGSRRKN